ncbi:MAG: EAL domain-containing protein [Rhodocyclaceae bacterium]|jgi:diguanylate cyclase (GGDEF)-like protein/PAS domain S-box-containing protein|nr:EAL domain-containing protein [Rhodocyclaceae bacterium]
MTQAGTTSPPRRTIRRQALVRLVGVMLVLVTGISTIGLNSFYTRQAREVEQKTATTRNFYAELLPKLESEWLTQASQLRARIEFTRILEERGSAETRWAKLNTLLTAQWEFLEFSNLLLLGPDDRVLYRYGTEAHRMPHSLQAILAAWHFDSGNRELYRVIQVPIWLGDAGQGSLVLYRALNTGALQKLASPETHVHLHAFGTLIASSIPGTQENCSPGRQGLQHIDHQPFIQVDLDWPHDSAQAPTVIVHRAFEESIGFGEFMVRPLVAITFVSLMLWLGLGRWLTRHVRRIESLDAGVSHFADHRIVAPAAQALAPAHAVHDEIRDVAESLEDMMTRVNARDAEQRVYLDTLAMLEEAVLELDCDGRIVHASPGWHRLTHCPDNLQGTSITEFIHQYDADAMHQVCQAFRNGEKNQAQLRLRLRNDDGVEQWAECRLIAQTGPQGTLNGIRGILRDITQTYLHEQQITHMALHDALTDLPNRILLDDRIKIATRMASRSEKYVAVCFIDLDHFKKINDSLGHKAGDRLLVAFARRLREQLRSGDTLARWGGDEFVLLLPELTDLEAAREVARKVDEALKQPVELDDSDYLVTFSMGVALYPDDALDVEGLLSHADRAMFYAKTQGRNQTCFFREIADKGGGKRELYIQNKLVEAVQAERIQAWFQPIVNAANGDCQVVEVLARWHDSEFGWVSPATFIPIAESTGAIRDLGRQIWLQSLDALQAWRRRGHAVRAAINVSKRQLFSNHFTEQLMGELALKGLSPDDVVLEVTESIALLDVANASERLEDLHRSGFHIAIDDFGTGYSALSQLHEMPVDELKIDISFVRRINEPSGRSMVQAIIQLARALGLKITAEGVENEAAANLLKSLGADYLQGYHFARPMPRGEFDAWLSGPN